jgi:hypothetical protein
MTVTVKAEGTRVVPSPIEGRERVYCWVPLAAFNAVLRAPAFSTAITFSQDSERPPVTLSETIGPKRVRVAFVSVVITFVTRITEYGPVDMGSGR